MSLTFKISRQTSNLDKLKERILKLKQASVESGYFAEQGEHPYAEMSYASLATLQTIGKGTTNKRDIRPLVIKAMRASSFRGIYTRSLTDYLYKGDSLDESLSKVGLEITSIAKSYFGIPHPLYNEDNAEAWAEYKGGNTPLVHYGYLQDAWSYKTSETPTIRGVS